jgi:hypothetical protein
MDLEVTEGDQQEPSSQAGRPPPIILTSATKLLQLQKKLRGLVKGSFEFRNSKNGDRVVTREMADFSAVKAYFTSENLSFYTFFPLISETREGRQQTPSFRHSCRRYFRGADRIRIRRSQRQTNVFGPKNKRRGLPTKNPSSLPHHLTQDGKITVNIQAHGPLSYCN